MRKCGSAYVAVQPCCSLKLAWGASLGQGRGLQWLSIAPQQATVTAAQVSMQGALTWPAASVMVGGDVVLCGGRSERWLARCGGLVRECACMIHRRGCGR